jgi:hypothetical protein
MKSEMRVSQNGLRDGKPEPAAIQSIFREPHLEFLRRHR